MIEFARHRKANFLRLVQPEQVAAPLDPASLVRFAWQRTLFAADHPALLAIVDFSSLPVADFLTLLTTARPKMIFDLRRAPRFDTAHLNRRLVFDLFASSGTTYLDLSGKLGAAGAADLDNVRERLQQALGVRENFQGPVLTLVDREQFNDEFMLALADVIPTSPERIWDILKLPMKPQPVVQSGVKPLIFISHANPEDNNFATWLTGKLAIAGFSVWSDVTKLIGGELIWDDIEDAIRNHTATVIVALSRISQTKNGVLDEVDLAVRIERAQGLANFVIPIRVDDLPFSEVRANLARKNIIDFNRSWAEGLSSLLRVLARNQVPRQSDSGAATLSHCLDGGIRVRAKVIQKPETLISNWLLISKLPEKIALFDVGAPADQISTIASGILVPTFRYFRLIGAFGDSIAAAPHSENPLTLLYSIPMADFLAGAPKDLPGLKRSEASRIVSSLVRQSWNKRMSERGLVSFELASGALAWFLPHDGLENDKVTFVDQEGKRRRKQLVGWSERRRVFWHAAFEARVVMSEPARIVLRPHVIFTEDGSNPVFSTVRMHALRRSFCRSWWNDRWRDLLLGFVSIFANDSEIDLQVGQSLSIRLTEPLRVHSEFAPQIDEGPIAEDSEPADALDDGAADESFDDLQTELSGDVVDELEH